MKDYLQGWKNVKDVYIPPVKQKGFKENVIIRKYMPAKKVERISKMLGGMKNGNV